MHTYVYVDTYIYIFLASRIPVINLVRVSISDEQNFAGHFRVGRHQIYTQIVAKTVQYHMLIYNLKMVQVTIMEAHLVIRHMGQQTLY